MHRCRSLEEINRCQSQVRSEVTAARSETGWMHAGLTALVDVHELCAIPKLGVVLVLLLDRIRVLSGVLLSVRLRSILLLMLSWSAGRREWLRRRTRLSSESLRGRLREGPKVGCDRQSLSWLRSGSGRGSGQGTIVADRKGEGGGSSRSSREARSTTKPRRRRHSKTTSERRRRHL